MSCQLMKYTKLTKHGTIMTTCLTRMMNIANLQRVSIVVENILACFLYLMLMC